MTLIDDIRAGRRMNSAKFTLNEHCFRQGDSPLDLWDFEQGRPLLGWTYVGWVPASSTCIANSNWGKDYPLAVMLENDKGERVWCHVPVPNTEEMQGVLADLLRNPAT